MPGAVVPICCSAMFTPTRDAVLSSGCCAADGSSVAWMITPWASVSSTRQSVPRSAASSWCSSTLPACSSCRLRFRLACARLRLTCSKLTGSCGFRCDERQRIHDWITASPTSPDGRAPSSKNCWRASDVRCSAVWKKSWRGVFGWPDKGVGMACFLGRVAFISIPFIGSRVMRVSPVFHAGTLRVQGNPEDETGAREEEHAFVHPGWRARRARLSGRPTTALP